METAKEKFKKSIVSCIENCPRFEILERVKKLLYYTYEVDAQNHCNHFLGFTKTERGANRKINAYCKNHKIDNFIIITKTNIIT